MRESDSIDYVDLVQVKGQTTGTSAKNRPPIKVGKGHFKGCLFIWACVCLPLPLHCKVHKLIEYSFYLTHSNICMHPIFIHASCKFFHATPNFSHRQALNFYSLAFIYRPYTSSIFAQALQGAHFAWFHTTFKLPYTTAGHSVWPTRY